LSPSRLLERVRREIIRPEQSNIHAIDGLRGLALSIAALFHCALFLGFLTGPRMHTDWVAYLARNGWAGVTLFFVISGFLIGRILIQDLYHRQQLFFSSFFIRRSLRIFPAYYLVISVSLCLIAPLHLPAFSFMYQTTDWHELFSKSWSSYLYVQNYVNPGRHASILNWGWSLCVEEQFYLLIPPTLWLLFKVRTERARQIAILTLVLLPILGRAAQYASDPNIILLDGFYYYSHNRIDEILVGVAIAYFYVVHRQSMQRICERLGSWLGIAGLAGFVVIWTYGSVFESNAFTIVFQFLVMAIAAGLVLLNCLFTNNLLTRFFTLSAWYPLARVSYGCYLIHPFILFGLLQLSAGHLDFAEFHATGLLALYLVVMVLTWVVAAVMFLLLENPLLALGAQLSAKSRAAAMASTSALIADKPTLNSPSRRGTS
jgi:peptidoglycan/LPS O-acetylase OafA/YrhL